MTKVFSKNRLSIFLLIAAAVAVVPAAATRTRPVAIRASEIKIQGLVQSVDEPSRTVVLEVYSYVLPNGRQAFLNPTKRKTVSVPVALWPELIELRNRRKATFTGLDSGTGSLLVARTMEAPDPTGLWRCNLPAGKPRQMPTPALQDEAEIQEHAEGEFPVFPAQ